MKRTRRFPNWPFKGHPYINFGIQEALTAIFGAGLFIILILSLKK